MVTSIFLHCQSCPVFTCVWEGIDILSTIEKYHYLIQRCGNVRDDIAREQKSERKRETKGSNGRKAKTDDIEKLHPHNKTVAGDPKIGRGIWAFKLQGLEGCRDAFFERQVTQFNIYTYISDTACAVAKRKNGRSRPTTPS